MKPVIALVFLLWTSFVQAQYSTWTEDQRRWYWASNAFMLTDWVTTRDMTRRYNEGYWERNPILGRQPSTDRLDLYFVSLLIGHYFLTDYLSSSNRDIYLRVVTVVEAGATANNLSIGLRLRF